jgi:hypothetical protein
MEDTVETNQEKVNATNLEANPEEIRLQFRASGSP